MKQRVITGILFTLAILAFVIPGLYSPFFPVALNFIVCAFTAFEMSNALRAKGLKHIRAFIYVGAALSLIPVGLLAVIESPYVVFSAYVLTALLYSMTSLLLPQLISASDGTLGEGIAIACASLYLSFPLACANIIVLFMKNGWIIYILGLFAPWISDVFAYFTGVLFGRHKVVPHISPKKTWEGCIGGVVGCAAVVGFVFSFFVYPILETRLSFPVFVALSILAGIALSVLSQFGDWTASAIKRWTGIKDFGTLLPGHGGLLDRFDSAFFTLPVAFAFGLFLL